MRRAVPAKVTCHHSWLSRTCRVGQPEATGSHRMTHSCEGEEQANQTIPVGNRTAVASDRKNRGFMGKGLREPPVSSCIFHKVTQGTGNLVFVENHQTIYLRSVHISVCTFLISLKEHRMRFERQLAPGSLGFPLPSGMCVT